MFILLFGGLLADAMNRRKLMMITQGSLFFVSGSLALLTLAGDVTPLKLYAVTVFLALFSSLEVPSRQSIVTNLVPAEDLSRALAIFSSQRQIATIGGPSLAGLVLAIAGPTACYAVDAISWLIMFGSLALIRTRLPHHHVRFASRGFPFCLGTCRHLSILDDGLWRQYFRHCAVAFSHLRARHSRGRAARSGFALCRQRRWCTARRVGIEFVGTGAARRAVDSCRRDDLRPLPIVLRQVAFPLVIRSTARGLRYRRHDQRGSARYDQSAQHARRAARPHGLDQ